MTPEEYAAAQAAATAGLAAYVQRFASLFVGSVLTIAEWLTLLQVLFPEVQRRYAEAAELGRQFYDSQRRVHHPELPRSEMLRSELQWEWFVKNMEPARKGMSQADAPQVAVTRTAAVAVREVQMAARRQIIGAVKNDSALTEDAPPDTRSVVGWARVATGAETCAWCLMLISRGAELNHKGNLAYREAVTAGIRLDDETAIDLFNEAGGDLKKFREETKDYIEEWHVGCDCLVVPVFDLQDWPGRAGAKHALELWVEAGKEADRLIKSGKARTKNNNKETLNALRRSLTSGDILVSSYALAA